jgi:hypothetical protein
MPLPVALGMTRVLERRIGGRVQIKEGQGVGALVEFQFHRIMHSTP